MVSMTDVDTFQSEMDQIGANYQTRVYEGAKHGFTSPNADTNATTYGLDLGYSETADNQSWDEMISLFNRTFV